MKKTILALTILAAYSSSAQAQSTVTVGGVIQANAKSYQIGNTTRSTVTELRIDDDYTSRFWLTGREDLGGGLSALFFVENRLNTDQSSTTGIGNGLGNGDTFFGLKGPWGQLTIGKHTMLYAQGIMTEMGGNGITAAPSSAWGTFTILSEMNGFYITPTRVNNSVLYKTPVVNGFGGSFGYGASGSNGNEGQAGTSSYADGAQYYLQAGYTSGPVYLNLAYWRSNAEGRPVVITGFNADQRQIRFSSSYAFNNGLKIGFQIDRAAFLSVGHTAVLPGADMKRVAWEVPLSYTFGSNTLLASYSRAGEIIDASNTGAKMYTLGWDYALSKRTNIGIFASKLSNDAAGTYQPFLAGTSATGSALAAGESATTVALGIKHTF